MSLPLPLTARRSIAALGLLAAASAGCTSRSAHADGTRRMVDTLAALYARAAAHPQGYEFLNRERIDAIRSDMIFQQGATGGTDALQTRFGLAQELVRAGDTRAALAELDTLQHTPGLAIDPAIPQNKQFFDLQAIAWLRLGEQANCNLDPSTSVCILGELHHTQQEGALHAIDAYRALLARYPDDLSSRWLLNIAYMAVGGYPSHVPRQWLIPGLTTRRDTTFPRFTNVAPSVGASITGLAGGLCVEDFNRDGLLDLFTTEWGLNAPPHFLVADGHGGYVDRTKAAGVDGIIGGPFCTHADYDNDGYDDILIVRGGWLGDGGVFPMSLLRNRGDGTFEDVTFAARLDSRSPRHSAAWADFNGDGYLDLFVGDESGTGLGWGAHRSELFLNNRDGTFTEVSHKVGIDVEAFVKGVAWGDVNNDGRPDLFVSVMGGPNLLFMNRGGKSIDTWRFEEVGAKAGVQLPMLSFPAWFWDYDNDGWEDLIVFGYDNRAPLAEQVAREYLGLAPLPGVEHTHLYRNRHDGTFEDVTEQVGLADKAIYAMGSNFGDIDNDGWLDFYVGTGNPDLRSVIPNRMFRNVGGKRFEEVTVEGGFGHLQKGHGAAFADLDRDGDEDVFMVMGGAYAGDVSPSVLFENPGWPGRSWLTLELQGTVANRSAIGARVEIDVADSSGTTRAIYRTVGTGGSYGTGTLQLHVGLAAATRIPLVRVTWPDSLRSVTTYTDLTPRQTYRLVQGKPAQRLDRPPVPFRHGVAAAAPMKMAH